MTHKASLILSIKRSDGYSAEMFVYDCFPPVYFIRRQPMLGPARDCEMATRDAAHSEMRQELDTLLRTDNI